MRVCVRACVQVCVCACVRVCMHELVSNVVCEIYKWHKLASWHILKIMARHS